MITLTNELHETIESAYHVISQRGQVNMKFVNSF